MEKNPLLLELPIQQQQIALQWSIPAMILRGHTNLTSTKQTPCYVDPEWSDSAPLSSSVINRGEQQNRPPQSKTNTTVSSMIQVPGHRGRQNVAESAVHHVDHTAKAVDASDNIKPKKHVQLSGTTPVRFSVIRAFCFISYLSILDFTDPPLAG